MTVPIIPIKFSCVVAITQWIDSDGYVCVRTGSGVRYEHSLVAEATLGRRLRKGEEVHHLDGCRMNNAPGNLRVMTRLAHRRLHGRENAKTQKRGPDGRFCRKGG